MPINMFTQGRRRRRRRTKRKKGAELEEGGGTTQPLQEARPGGVTTAAGIEGRWSHHCRDRASDWKAIALTTSRAPTTTPP